MYSIVLNSAVQHSESVIHTCILFGLKEEVLEVR